MDIFLRSMKISGCLPLFRDLSLYTWMRFGNFVLLCSHLPRSIHSMSKNEGLSLGLIRLFQTLPSFLHISKAWLSNLKTDRRSERGIGTRPPVCKHSLSLSNFSTHVDMLSCSVMSNSAVPMYWSLPGSSVHEIFQTRVLEWVAISYSKGSSWPRDQICIFWISCIGRWIFCYHTTWVWSWINKPPMFCHVGKKQSPGCTELERRS